MNKDINKNVEILAPAGSMESLYAAIENGANAIYLGGKVFNARKNALNFDDEQLKEAVQYAHIRNVRVYVTLNILMTDSELEEIIEYLSFLYNIDVDAVIVQDLGLARLIKETLPDFEMHASTQMTINNYMGVKYLEELGFSRVVLARELSLEEIKFIKANTNMELEAFVHGALCMSYSGQCLMSSMIGGRSGNRGVCAQPCRMPYSIVKTETKEILSDDFYEKYMLSTKDLNTIDYLEDIVGAGITSFKIEGRMKKPEYVAIIVDNYKRVLDKILIGEKAIQVDVKDKKEMKQAFNRGFTKGYMMEERGKKFVSFDKPNNKGVLLGKIVRVDRNFLHVALEEPLAKGDGIEIITGSKRNKGFIVGNMYLNGRKVEYADKNDVVRIEKANSAKENMLLYKTLDVNLFKRAKQTYVEKQNLKKIAVTMNVTIEIGMPLQLELWDNEGNRVSVTSEELVETGIRVSLTEEKVMKQISKLGGTAYSLEKIDIKLMENSMIASSILNSIRREAISELDKMRGNSNNRIQIGRKELGKKGREILRNSKKSNQEIFKGISVKVETLEQFRELDLEKLDRVYLNFTDNLKNCIDEVKEEGKEVYIATEKIIRNDEFDELEKVINSLDLSKIDGISVSNVGTLKFIKDKYDVNIHGDIGLNIFNSSAVKLLQEYNVTSVTLSPELKLSQIARIASNSEILCETIGQGYLPLMTTKHCPMALIKGCKSDDECANCNFRTGYGLTDRKDMAFEMIRKNKITTIYNSQPMMMVDRLNEIYDENVKLVRLDFSIDKEEINEIQSMYYGFANGSISREEANDFVEEYKDTIGITRGHYYRGVI